MKSLLERAISILVVIALTIYFNGTYEGGVLSAYTQTCVAELKYETPKISTKTHGQITDLVGSYYLESVKKKAILATPNAPDIQELKQECTKRLLLIAAKE